MHTTIYRHLTTPDLTPAALAGLWKLTERMKTGLLPRSVIPNPPSEPRGIANLLTLDMTTRLGGTLVACWALAIT